MAAVSIVQLAERLLNHNNTQGQDTQSSQRVTNQGEDQKPLAAPQDQFTPSAQAGQGAAQEAGLFSVAQFSFFSAAAEFLLAQNTPPPVNPPTAAASSLTAPAALNAAPAAPLALPLLAPTANALNATGQVAPAAAGAGTALGAPTAQGPLALDQQLATLNQSLVALGLSPQEIQQLDRIASVINDFNPQAFLSLAFQLEQLAALSAPQVAATAATTGNLRNAANANAAPANPTAGNQAPGTGGGFRVRDFIIQFSGVQALVNAAGNGSGNAATVSAFNLQIEEVNLTLVNNIGQTAQIQAPRGAGKTLTAAGNSLPGKGRATAA